MNLSNIEKNLIDEIHLDSMSAKIFLLVTLQGKMTIDTISSKLGISLDDALKKCQYLVEQGGFIDIKPTEFEAMHPRFTAVNMYRRMCQRENITFGRNKTVDGIGVLLERYYDDVRTK